jgi:hypothetical protein
LLKFSTPAEIQFDWSTTVQLADRSDDKSGLRNPYALPVVTGHWKHAQAGDASAIIAWNKCNGFRPSISSTTPGIRPLKDAPSSLIAGVREAAPELILLM